MLKVEPKVEQLLQAALRHHQTGNVSEAEALYQQVLQLDPTNSDAMHLLGALAAQMQHREVAVDWIRRAIWRSLGRRWVVVEGRRPEP